MTNNSEKYYNLNKKETDNTETVSLVKDIPIKKEDKVIVKPRLEKKDNKFSYLNLLSFLPMWFIIIFNPLGDEEDKTKELTESKEEVIKIFEENNMSKGYDIEFKSTLNATQEQFFLEDITYIYNNAHTSNTEFRLSLDNLKNKWTPILEEADDNTRLELLNKSINLGNGMEHKDDLTITELGAVINYLNNLEDTEMQLKLDENK